MTCSYFRLLVNFVRQDLPFPVKRRAVVSNSNIEKAIMEKRESVAIKTELTEESGREANKRTSNAAAGVRKRDFDSVTGTRPKKISVRTDFGNVANSEQQSGEFHRPSASLSDTARRPEDVDPNYALGFQRYIELRKCHVIHHPPFTVNEKVWNGKDII